MARNPNQKFHQPIIKSPQQYSVDVELLRSSSGTFIPVIVFRYPEASKTLIYSHGNATDLGLMIPMYIFLCINLKINIVGYDYTGYGISKWDSSYGDVSSSAVVLDEFGEDGNRSPTIPQNSVNNQVAPAPEIDSIENRMKRRVISSEKQCYDDLLTVINWVCTFSEEKKSVREKNSKRSGSNRTIQELNEENINNESNFESIYNNDKEYNRLILDSNISSKNSGTTSPLLSPNNSTYTPHSSSSSSNPNKTNLNGNLTEDNFNIMIYGNEIPVNRKPQPACLVKDPTKELILYGQSLGSGPACYAASKIKVLGLILHSALLSGLRVLINSSVLSLLYDIFPNIKRIPNVKCPVFIMHGLKDDLVKPEHGKKLYDLGKFYSSYFVIFLNILLYFILFLVPNDYKYTPWFIEDRGHNNLIHLYENEFLQRVEAFIRFSSQKSRRPSEEYNKESSSFRENLTKWATFGRNSSKIAPGESNSESTSFRSFRRQNKSSGNLIEEKDKELRERERELVNNNLKELLNVNDTIGDPSYFLNRNR